MSAQLLETPPATRRSPSPNLVLAIASIGVFMTVLDLFIVNVAFPDIQRDFDGSTLSKLSWILNGYAIVYAALLVPAGRMADRIGQKRIFLCGLALFTIASALCAAAPNAEILIAARLVQAVGAAAVTPTSLALVLSAVSPERRGWALGMWTAVGGTGAAAGPTIGGMLVSLDWRWVFLVNLPIGIVSILIGVKSLQEHRTDPNGHRPDMLGALLLVFSIAALSLGIVQGPEWGWGSGRIIGSFVAAVVLIGGFIYRSSHHASPIVEPEIVKVPAFAIASISAFFFMASFSVLLLGLVQYMTDVWHYSPLRTGLAISPGPLMVPFVATRLLPRVLRFGAPKVAFFGALLYAIAAIYWFEQTGTSREYATVLLPGLIASGIGFGLTMPVLMASATRSLPAQRFATGSAVITMVRQIGSVFGVSILIVFLDSADGDFIGAFHNGWLFMAGTALVAGIAALALSLRPAPAGAPMPVALD
ncbi:MFS transporter [soil metagenome]